MTTRGIATALVSLLVAAPAALAQNPPGGPAPAPVDPAYPQDTPEAAFRSFFIAMATGDEPAMRRLALPAEGFEWLMAGEHVPKEQVGEFRKVVAERLVTKRLKAGDEVTMPNGRVVKIEPERVAEDRVVLYQPGTPMPTDLRRVDGAWRLDARPIVALRRAAAEARRRAEGAQKKAGP